MEDKLTNASTMRSNYLAWREHQPCKIVHIAFTDTEGFDRVVRAPDGCPTPESAKQWFKLNYGRYAFVCAWEA